MNSQNIKLKDDLRNFLQVFKKYFRGHYSLIVLALLLATISQIGSLIIPILSKVIIDVVIIKGFYNYFNVIMLIGVTLLVGEALVSILANYLLYRMLGLAGMKYKLNFFKKLQFAPFSFYQKIDIGSMTHRTLTDTEKVISFWMQSLVGIPSILVLLVSFGLMVWYHKGMTVLVLILLVFEVLVIISFNKPLLKYSFLSKEKSQALTSFVVKHFSMIELIRSSATEKREQKNLFGFLREKFGVDVKAFMVHKSAGIVETFVNNIWVFIVLWYGSWQITQNQLSLGSMMAFLLLAGILNKPVRVIITLILTYQNVRASLYRIAEYESEQQYIEINPQAKEFWPEEGRIQVRNVSFGYTPNLTILEDVNLDITPNKITAIVGRSGVGKSTLCKLLVRFHTPHEGQILLDEQDIREIKVKSLRETVHLCLQSNYTFSGTIWDNLTYGIDHVDKKEILKAAMRAGMDFINELPLGYNTPIGDQGLSISGGEAQKIGFARALLKKPKVYIFDEITAALDQKSEERIKKTLVELKKDSTIVMIAHKPSTLEIADEVVIVDNGQVTKVQKDEYEIDQNLFVS